MSVVVSKREGVDASTERLICTGMVVSDRVCRELAQCYRPELMTTDFTRWVGDVCIAFFEKHGTAPRKHVQDLFHTASRRGRMEPGQVRLIREFLKGISSEYERADHFNEGYVMDQAIHYFRGRSLYLIKEEVGEMLEGGDVDEAETRLAQYRKVDRVADTGLNPFKDIDLIQRAFEQQQQPLFELPGAIGQLTNIQWKRKNFVSVMGVVGRGKTYTLQEMAKYAAAARCNVVFIGIGDMSDEEYALRWAVNLSGRSEDPDDCVAGWVPCPDCRLNQNNSCTLPQRVGKVGLPEEMQNAEAPAPEDAPRNYKPCSACSHEADFQGVAWRRLRKAVKPLEWNEAYHVMQRFSRRMKGKDFKLLAAPSKALTPHTIDSQLERWRDFEQFIPDVLILDYMDELGVDAKFDQFRHQEAEKWSSMRGLAQKWNMLIITAEQADAGGYDKETLGLGNFNEDRRRNDVVTGKLTLNRTPAEEQSGITRFAWAKLRKGRFKLCDQVQVLQCFTEGRPMVASWWRPTVE